MIETPDNDGLNKMEVFFPLAEKKSEVGALEYKSEFTSIEDWVSSILLLCCSQCGTSWFNMVA